MSQPARNIARFHPQQARYFDQVNAELQLTPEELAMLERNGFLVTDRLTFEQFKRAYAWIYWKDLPVLVTTDAILHTIHQAYDELLKQVETTILTQKLINVLSGTRTQLLQSAPNAPDALKQIYADLDTYVTIPLVMLSSDERWVFSPRFKDWSHPLPEQAQGWLAQISQVNNEWNTFDFKDVKDGHLMEQACVPVGIEVVTLSGLKREVDFTQFKARGHYDEPPALVAYFCAMMWLQLIDFRFVGYDQWGTPHLHREQLIAAHLLRDSIDKAGQRSNWEAVEQLLMAFVGWSDLITLNGLDRLIADANVQSPLDWSGLDERQLLRQILQTDYGQQRIRGQIQTRAKDLNGDLPHNVSFALMGQRYTIESDILQQLVYDKLHVPGHPDRAYPSPLDVLYALGHDRALVHLQADLERFGYADALHTLRDWASTHSEEFWQSTFYNRWLRAILTLNQETSGDEYPPMMRSDAWQDKMLHTQLSSWTQLRHDNILYVKPPYSPAAVCEYPAGYVEPYPAFYQALGEYARLGREVFATLELDDPCETVEEAKARLGDYWRKNLGEIRPAQAVELRQIALRYFDHLETTMLTLEQMARKELKREPFSEAETLFLRSIMVRKYVGDSGYGGMTEEHWNGWYNDLLPFGDQRSPLVADVHTNYNSSIGDVGVLHLGISNPVLMISLIESDGQDTVYVGPAFTLYEHLERGTPPHRLTDSEWHGLLYKQSDGRLTRTIKTLQDALEKLGPDKAMEQKLAEAEAQLANPVQAPPWTQSFRLAAPDPRELKLPSAYEDFKASLSPHLRDRLDEMYDGAVKTRRDGMPRYLKVIAQLVMQAPTSLLSPEGIDQAMLDELSRTLDEKGHLTDE